MNAINIWSNRDKYLITIDKKAVDEGFVLKLLEWLNLENLAQRVGIDEDMTALSEEIKADWWQANKSRFIPEGQ